MGSKRSRRRVVRTTKIESLEDRQMFSADPLGGLLGSVEQHAYAESPVEQHAPATPDFWYDTSLERDLNALLGGIEQNLATAHMLTGVSQAREDYGFDGAGQTVAVIDSGIAFDHASLGGGFGSNYRVVGGWDFTEENDANPYDDGPSGSHGSHVAGIVGATSYDQSDSGVAPGVDFIGLRVFNDQGAGYFSWVEKALKWVHTNRDAFANPITAVNLSLGTAWNAATVPSWAMLEDEFAQLEADGIFIAVSAGNSFSSYNTAGLSYPAASSHVVPVMSVDDTGTMSYFSQRHTRAIAAPGRYIRSTVPDYVGNQNGVTDDWANYSGTSMAAPYVAGASVIIREAMQFVGYANITQDTIYDHMMATADEFFDAATNQFYKRLNVGAALDALVPDDDFGSTAGAAHDLGTVGASGAELSGLIGKRNDVDYFRFTAAARGTVTFTAETTHNLDAAWTGGGIVSGPDDNTYTINVLPGQSYTVGLSTGDGLGYFDLTIAAESEFTFTDWGTVTQLQTNNLGNTGESWYRVQAGQSGFLTAEAYFAGAGGNIELAWFDLDLQQVAPGVAQVGGQRVDQIVSASEELYLKVTGTNADVDFRLTNLVSQSDSMITVIGTSDVDTFAFSAGTVRHAVSVNGVAYQFDASTVSSLQFLGGLGDDTINLTGSISNDIATLRFRDAQLEGSGYIVNADAIENVTVYGSGGNDTAYLYGSAGDDRFYGGATYARIMGSGFNHYAQNFELSYTYADQGGNDTAYLYGSAGDDRFYGGATYARIMGSGFNHYAQNFELSYTYADQGGNDTAYLYGSAGDDRFYGGATYARIMGSGFNHYAQNFELSYTYADQGGNDTAYLYGSAGDDRFYGGATYARIMGSGFNHYAQNFELSYTYADQGGNDTAYLYGSAGDDRFYGGATYARIMGSGFNHYAQNFELSYTYADQGGNDTAYLYGSAGDDRFYGGATYARIMGSGFNHYAQNFELSYTYADQGGNDTAYLYGSAGDDYSYITSTYVRMLGAGFNNYAQGFAKAYAYADQGGNDKASLCDVGGSDSVYGRDDYIFDSRAGRDVWACDFKNVTAYAKDGEDPNSNVEAVDYLFERIGNWG